MVDHCSAIGAVLDDGEIGRTYHVGTGLERSVDQLADAVLAALGRPSSLKTIVPDRPGHDRRYLLDSSRIQRELGWHPTVAFDEGLASTVDWYVRNRTWWEPLRDRAPVAEATAWMRSSRQALRQVLDEAFELAEVAAFERAVAVGAVVARRSNRRCPSTNAGSGLSQ